MKDALYERFNENFHKSIAGHTLIEWGRELAKTDDLAFMVEHSGNLFKLYSLYSYLNFPYLHIMPNQRKTSEKPFKLIYLDIFAGSGLNKIETNGRKYYVCGSAILTLIACYLRSQGRSYSCYFDHMILIDQKGENTSLLSKRMKLVAEKLGIDSDIGIGNNVEDITSNVVIAKGDVTNDQFVLSLVYGIEQIWNKDNRIHVMMFIDPDSPSNLKMQTLKRLLKYPGDLLILLHPGIFTEMTLKKRYKEETLISMLDIDQAEAQRLLREKLSQAELNDYYIQKYERAIRETPIKRFPEGRNKRDVIIKVPIKTKQSYYHLIYATRKTNGDSSGWQKPFEDFATWIGKQSNIGELELQVLTGSQSRFDDFFS